MCNQCNRDGISVRIIIDISISFSVSMGDIVSNCISIRCGLVLVLVLVVTLALVTMSMRDNVSNCISIRISIDSMNSIDISISCNSPVSISCNSIRSRTNVIISFA